MNLRDEALFGPRNCNGVGCASRVRIPEARSPGYLDWRFENAILTDAPREKPRLS